MAADAYLSSAESQIRDAISALQDDIRHVQMTAYDHEHQLEHEISEEQTEASVLKYARTEALAQAHDLGFATAEEAVHHLEEEANHKKHEVDQESINAANKVRDMQNIISQLQEMASKLNSIIPSTRQ